LIELSCKKSKYGLTSNETERGVVGIAYSIPTIPSMLKASPELLCVTVLVTDPFVGSCTSVTTSLYRKLPILPPNPQNHVKFSARGLWYGDSPIGRKRVDFELTGVVIIPPAA